MMGTQLLQQDPGLVDFGLRRFRLRSGRSRGVLETAGRSFLTGFNAAISRPADAGLARAIGELDAPQRGFAYEGAGMACALLDVLTCSGGRNLRRLLDGSGQPYRHLVHVGAGWAFAKLRLRPGWGRAVLEDPLLRWLAWDGYGFHQGFFHADQTVGRKRIERGITADQRAIRDQGLGRALWFHECADPDGVALRVGEFPAGRRGDLWSGVGLAATYAGGAEPDELELLCSLAEGYRGDLAQGCAFACEARRVSGIVPAHTEITAFVLAGVSPETAGGWTSTSLAALGSLDGSSAQYQEWRAGIKLLWFEQAEGHCQ